MKGGWAWARFCLSVVLSVALLAAPRAEAQEPTFTPDHPTGIYGAGERVGWTATLPEGSGAAALYRYVVRRDGGELLSTDTLDLRAGRGRIETSLSGPGMVLVEVTPLTPDSTFGSPATGGAGRVLLGAAVEPTGIRPAEPEPADFDAFWAAKLKELEAVPMSPVVRPGESGVPDVEYATVRLDNVRGSHVYGQLARPVGGAKLPALVIFQWAGGPYPLQKSWVTDRARQGWLVLNVEPHDVPGDLPQAFYDALPTLIKNYHTIGQHSRDESYFLRMYLGDYRAVEYLAGRPDWDGRTMVVMGTSMGGQQSFATAGLNPRVTALIVSVPAGADVTAPLHGRGASYPFWDVDRPEVLATARYFDPANFAPHITARALVAMGFIDEVARPTGIWAVYNRIQGLKEAVPLIDSPHDNLASPRQLRPYRLRAEAWLDALVHPRDPSLAEPYGLSGGAVSRTLSRATRSWMSRKFP
jgi:cephalosporin-C deacetylase